MIAVKESAGRRDRSPVGAPGTGDVAPDELPLQNRGDNLD